MSQYLVAFKMFTSQWVVEVQLNPTFQTLSPGVKETVVRNNGSSK